MRRPSKVARLRAARLHVVHWLETTWCELCNALSNASTLDSRLLSPLSDKSRGTERRHMRKRASKDGNGSKTTIANMINFSGREACWYCRAELRCKELGPQTHRRLDWNCVKAISKIPVNGEYHSPCVRFTFWNEESSTSRSATRITRHIVLEASSLEPERVI